MKIGIEGQRLFRVKKHGMDMVALELIRNLQKIDKENEYFIFVKPDEDRNCLRRAKISTSSRSQVAPTLFGSNMHCQKQQKNMAAIFCIALVIQRLYLLTFPSL